MDGWCGNCYFTICGEKIYIEDVRKPSKIDGFSDLTIAYEKSEEGRGTAPFSFLNFVGKIAQCDVWYLAYKRLKHNISSIFLDKIQTYRY